MQKVKVIQMGIGTVGKAITKGLVKKKGIEVVGALDLDSGKVGKDLGEVAELNTKLNIAVTDDADTLFSETFADVVIHTVDVHLHEVFPQIIKPIQQGIDVISASEALGNPYVSEPVFAAKLEKLAKTHGVTVLGSGFSPGFGSDYLILALTGACSDVQKITYVRRANARPYMRGTVGRHFGLGLPVEAFKRGVEEGVIIGHIGFMESLQTIVDRFGWDLETIQRSVEPVHNPQGQFVSTKTSVRGIKGGDVKIALELEAFIDPDMETLDSITIEGMPPISVVIKPCIGSVQATANMLINAIPHVINAEPGLLTPGDLPLVFALENDVRMFLK
jgi:hypothetical protein